jgi:hypothetical protein
MNTHLSWCLTEMTLSPFESGNWGWQGFVAHDNRAYGIILT